MSDKGIMLDISESHDMTKRTAIVTQRMYNWLMDNTPEDVKTKEDLIKFINNRKFTADQIMDIGVSDRQIDEILIQPEFK